MDGPLQKSARAIDNKTIELTGLSETHEGVTGQVKFNALSRIVNTGGTTIVDDIELISKMPPKW
jgi:alpha-L-fucosidase 2